MVSPPKYLSHCGCCSGTLSIGIANTASTVTASVENDLATNTTYLVVSRYNVATGESGLGESCIYCLRRSGSKRHNYP